MNTQEFGSRQITLYRLHARKCKPGILFTFDIYLYIILQSFDKLNLSIGICTCLYSLFTMM